MTLFKSLQLTFDAERFFKSYLVDLGNGKVGSSRYLLYVLILYSVERKETNFKQFKRNGSLIFTTLEPHRSVKAE